MSTLRQMIGRIKLQWRGKNHIVGWKMTPQEAVSFIRSRGKVVLTFYGYSGMGYEDEEDMLKHVREVLSQYRPDKTLVVAGATRVGIGAVYPLAKSMGFETAGIVTTRSLKEPERISEAVDYVCFIPDDQWGGKLPDSDELSPTSRAMVDSSDILVGIGGGGISQEEMLEGKKQGKPIQYFPAEMHHETAIRYAEKMGLPPPASFAAPADEVFGK